MGHDNERIKIVELLSIAEKGPVRPRDLDERRIPRTYLRRLCDRGIFEKVDRGVYRLADVPVTELSSVADVAKRVTHGVVCLLSALQVHELRTEAPSAVWVLIGRHARSPKTMSTELQVVRASGRALEQGVETRVIEGVPLKLTTPAKTVADCFRFRRRVGLPVALEALGDYLQKRAGSVDELVDSAQAGRVYSFMRPYLEAMV